MFEHLRIEKASDPKELLRLAGTVGWNQTLNDCEELVLRQDAVCFFALDGDRVIGSAAAKFYGGRQMGYINMVIVLEPYRGHHIATRMLRTLMEHLKDFKTLRLYATDAGSHVYSKLGFTTYAMMHKYFRKGQPVPRAHVLFLQPRHDDGGGAERRGGVPCARKRTAEYRLHAGELRREGQQRRLQPAERT